MSLSDSLAGVLGGVAGTVVGQPFDLIKVRMQTGDGKLGSSPISVLIKIVRNEGIRTLFRGIAFPLIGYVPVNVVVFGAYGKAEQTLVEMRRRRSDKFKALTSSPPTTATDSFLAGAFAGAIQVPICAPVEAFKIRMQTQMTGSNRALNPRMETLFRNSSHALKSIIQNEGLTGVYRGVVATALRDVLGYGLYFGIFHLFCDYLKQDKEKKAGHLVTFVSGGMSGFVCYGICYPLDTIKSRVQGLRNKSIISAAREVLQSGGILGFYKGLGPTLMRAFPENAAVLYTYEMVIRWLKSGQSSGDTVD
eukprot:jgi/Bigna1/65246/fgenesh1_kg.101_\